MYKNTDNRAEAARTTSGSDHCQLQGRYVTGDSTFMVWINANNCTCVIFYQSNNAMESNCIVVAKIAHLCDFNFRFHYIYR